MSGAAGAGTAATGAGRLRADFLEGVRVLELGDGVAGAAATSILWALGAEVTTAVDPRSVHRRGRPAVDRHGAPVSLLALALDRGKHQIEITTPAELDAALATGDHDLVVVDRVGGAAGALAGWRGADDYATAVTSRNRGAWVTISAFGLTGPRRDDVATELTLAAAAGLVAAVRDPRTGAPMKLGGQQSLLNTGQVAALASCDALDRAAGAPPVHLDLSAHEAGVATGPVLDLVALFFRTGTLGGAQRYGAPASFYACTDGLIRISAMEDHQWRGVVAAMGSPDWAERFSTVESRIEGAAEVNERVAAWAGTVPKTEAERTLQAHGVPATAMYSPAELLASPQLLHREAFDPLVLDDGRETVVVAPPFRVVAGGNQDARCGARRRRSLRGLRVLEAGHVLAVPLAGALLGALGAEVTKLEDLDRIDMYRRNGPYIDREAGMERAAYFAFANHSKRNAAFHVEQERDRLAALLDDADVFVENVGPKRARALGVAASVALDAHPQVLAISSSGFGQDGPFASYRAYAYNMHASAALGYLTRNEDGESAEIDLAWGDLVSAYAVATIVAAWAVGPTGNRGAGLDYSMADAIVSHFTEFLAAARLDPASDATVDRANEVSPYAPHGVYPTTDGWVALAVDGDEQFAALRTVLDHPLLRAPELAAAEDRLARRCALDGLVAAATRERAGAELAAALRAAGVPAEVVVAAPELVADPHLTARAFFPEVEHPVWGRRRLIGLPWRPYGTQPYPLGPPPVLPGGSDEGAEA